MKGVPIKDIINAFNKKLCVVRGVDRRNKRERGLFFQVLSLWQRILNNKHVSDNILFFKPVTHYVR